MLLPGAPEGTPARTTIRTCLESPVLHEPSLKELQPYCASSDRPSLDLKNILRKREPAWQKDLHGQVVVLLCATAQAPEGATAPHEDPPLA